MLSRPQEALEATAGSRSGLSTCASRKRGCRRWKWPTARVWSWGRAGAVGSGENSRTLSMRVKAAGPRAAAGGKKIIRSHWEKSSAVMSRRGRVKKCASAKVRGAIGLHRPRTGGRRSEQRRLHWSGLERCGKGTVGTQRGLHASFLWLCDWPFQPKRPRSRSVAQSVPQMRLI